MRADTFFASVSGEGSTGQWGAQWQRLLAHEVEAPRPWPAVKTWQQVCGGALACTALSPVASHSAPLLQANRCPVHQLSLGCVLCLLQVRDSAIDEFAAAADNDLIESRFGLEEGDDEQATPRGAAAPATQPVAASPIEPLVTKSYI